MSRADLDWANLGFGYLRTDKNVRYTWRDGKWDDGALVSEEHIPLHMAATCLHYGQEAFEGLKVFEQKNGDAVAFRIDENAKRLARSCEKIFMAPVPEALFIDAVVRVVNANRRFIPPYGTADEFMFLIFVTPVGPYFKTGFKPVDMVIETEFDRAAPGGVGNVKVGGNYAAGMRATAKARAMGYTEAIYLDAREKRYIDESGPANFFAIDKGGQYVTPASESILPSVTNMSLITLAGDMGRRFSTSRRPGVAAQRRSLPP
jgi:branched-chain amino acid aminotransferase